MKFKIAKADLSTHPQEHPMPSMIDHPNSIGGATVLPAGYYPREQTKRSYIAEDADKVRSATDREPGEITIMTNQLASQLSLLGDNVAELLRAIEPVLAEHGPDGGVKEAEKERYVSCKMGASLRQLQEHAGRLISIVQSARERVRI